MNGDKLNMHTHFELVKTLASIFSLCFPIFVVLCTTKRKISRDRRTERAHKNISNFFFLFSMLVSLMHMYLFKIRSEI